MPIDRGDRYEDAVLKVLGKRGDVVGGGSGGSSSGEIEYVDVELELEDDPKLIEKVIDALERRGAPKHSRLSIYTDDGDRSVELGIAEGIGIYFDGVNLPAEVYRECTLDDLCEKLAPLLEDPAEIRGSWVGATQTALYLYGLDAEELWRTIEPVVRAYPLSKGARVVVRLGHEDGKPREIKL